MNLAKALYDAHSVISAQHSKDRMEAVPPPPKSPLRNRRQDNVARVVRSSASHLSVTPATPQAWLFYPGEQFHLDTVLDVSALALGSEVCFS